MERKNVLTGVLCVMFGISMMLIALNGNGLIQVIKVMSLLYALPFIGIAFGIWFYILEFTGLIDIMAEMIEERFSQVIKV